MSVYSHRIRITPNGGEISGPLEVEDLRATGSLLGTASFALNAGSVTGTIDSASYALTASYVIGASPTSSYSITSSYSQTASLATSVILYDVAMAAGLNNDAAAAAAGVPIGGLYRNGNFVQIRIS